MTLDPVLARRLLAVSVAPVVIAAGIILYGFPGRTAELFAWPIAPRMTPIVMGAGYLAAAWFFFALYRSHDWAAVAPVHHCSPGARGLVRRHDNVISTRLQRRIPWQDLRPTDGRRRVHPVR